MNKKGFMMAELIVVSAVIIGTMTAFFISYSKIIARYNKIINYYDVGTIYRLGRYYENNPSSFKEVDAVTKKEKAEETITINGVTYTYKDTLYIGKCDNVKNKTNYLLTDTVLLDYIDYFSKLKLDNSKSCTILKSCQKNSKTSKEVCKFAYMEVSNAQYK